MPESIKVSGSEIATVAKASVRVFRTLGGYELHLAVTLTAAWSKADADVRLSIVGARLHAWKSGDRQLLGTAHAMPGSDFMVREKAAPNEVTLVLPMTRESLAALKDFARGHPLEVEAVLWGRADGAVPTRKSGHARAEAKMSRDEWTTNLREVGFSDSVLLEVPVPETLELVNALVHFRKAMEHEQKGNDADAVAECRNAIDALGHAGFGGKTPREIDQSLRQNAKHLSMEERFSVLKTALWMYCCPPHHAKGEDLGAADSTATIAVTAALLSLAPRRAPPVPKAEEADRGGALGARAVPDHT